MKKTRFCVSYKVLPKIMLKYPNTVVITRPINSYYYKDLKNTSGFEVVLNKEVSAIDLKQQFKAICGYMQITDNVIVNINEDEVYHIEGEIGFVEVNGETTRCIRNVHNKVVFIETITEKIKK
jgi:hypothetical protein